LPSCVEVVEGRAALDSDLVGSLQALVHNGGKVGVGEVQCFLGAVVDVLATKVAVQVHLAQSDGVRVIVALADGRHGVDVRLVRDSGESADRGLDGLREVLGVHSLADIHGAQVARDVVADGLVGEVLVEGGRRGDLQDLGAQVRVGDATRNRVGTVHGVLIHDVRVAG